MAWYVDTSAFLKLVVGEQHSDALGAWAEARDGALFASDLVRVEALRAARQHSNEAVMEARRRIGALWLLRLSADVCARAAELDPSILRTLDALHLASALAVGDELEGIATYDERLAAAARAHGVPVTAPA